MKAHDVAEAISALKDAARALNLGHMTIAEQVALASRCYYVAATLNLALKDVPVEIREAA